MSGPTNHVWKTLQPPFSTGSFEPRRVISVPQSLAASSTFSADLLQDVLRDERLRVHDRLVGRGHQDDLLALVAGLLDQRLGRSKSRLPVSASEPAVFAIGVPQVKNDGQGLPFLASPAIAIA